MSKQEFEPVMGLEVHVQLKTESKMFCGCSTKFGAEPNTQTCPVCLGLPGVLPVVNKKAVEYIIMTAFALNCKVQSFSKFDRKNYYYPDLPKNFQISQYDIPLTEHGWVKISNKKIGITRIHLEEDAGKLIHSPKGDASYVDLNRTGTPLMEIVSEPEINSPKEAHEYLAILKHIIEYLGVSDCNMEEGSLRCDANISLRPKGSSKLGTKAELKNMNSFKAVQKALEYEISRQNDVLTKGHKVVQETRLWNEQTETTHSMRSKEEAHDYRYFPEPDLLPLEIPKEWLEDIEEEIPEMPNTKINRFISEYNIPEYDAGVLTGSIELANYFEEIIKSGGENKVNPKLVSNWIMSELLRELNSRGITADKSPIPPQNLCKVIQLVEKGTISGKIAKEVFLDMFNTGKDPELIVKEKGLTQISDEGALSEVITKVISNNSKSVNDYKSGKEEAIKYLVGQVMKETRGKANPGLAQKILKEKL